MLQNLTHSIARGIIRPRFTRIPNLGLEQFGKICQTLWRAADSAEQRAGRPSQAHPVSSKSVLFSDNTHVVGRPKKAALCHGNLIRCCLATGDAVWNPNTMIGAARQVEPGMFPEQRLNCCHAIKMADIRVTVLR